MIATFRIAGNVGFLIYIADAFGYLGSVTIMLVRESMTIQVGWADFYARIVIVFAFIGFAGTLYSLYYFSRKFRHRSLRANA